MEKVLFVFHAKAGRGQIRDRVFDIISELNRSGAFVTVMMTQYSGHLTEIIEKHGCEYDLILISGGDGTANEAANGMLKLPRKVPLLYLPSGTTNDYASSLGIPTKIEDFLKIIREGKIFSSDVGLLNGRAFLYVAVFGTLAKVTYTTPQEEKNLLGYPAYVIELLKELPSMRPYHMRIETRDRVYEGDYLFGFFSNSFSVSGFRGVTGKNVALDDGLFEVTLIKNTKNIAEIGRILPSLFQNTSASEYMERFQTDRLKVVCDEEVEWNVDGEFGGRSKEAEIRVFPKAIDFMV